MMINLLFENFNIMVVLNPAEILPLLVFLHCLPEILTSSSGETIVGLISTNFDFFEYINKYLFDQSSFINYIQVQCKITLIIS